jgi:hypothetical protein
MRRLALPPQDQQIDGDLKQLANTRLFDAARYGDVNLCRAALDAKASLTVEHSPPGTDGTFFNALTLAVKYAQCNVVTMLLDAGADIESYAVLPGMRFTPLMIASSNAHKSGLRMIRLLCERKANVSAQSRMTPLLHAVSTLNIDAVKLLLEFGADLDAEVPLCDTFANEDMGEDMTMFAVSAPRVAWMHARDSDDAAKRRDARAISAYFDEYRKTKVLADKQDRARQKKRRKKERQKERKLAAAAAAAAAATTVAEEAAATTAAEEAEDAAAAAAEEAATKEAAEEGQEAGAGEAKEVDDEETGSADVETAATAAKPLRCYLEDSLD